LIRAPQSGARIRIMQPVEYFTWLLPGAPGDEPQLSRFKLTREQASAYPDALCIESTRELRMQAVLTGGSRSAGRVVAALPKGLPSKLPG
jgi:hypothetical protein